MDDKPIKPIRIDHASLARLITLMEMEDIEDMEDVPDDFKEALKLIKRNGGNKIPVYPIGDVNLVKWPKAGTPEYDAWAALEMASQRTLH